MFPVTEEILKAEEKIKTEIDRNFYKVAKYDFKNCRTIIKNGNIVLIDGVEAVIQWIEKFLRTSVNRFEVYKNTGFGTNARELFGKKYLDNGYEESELERQVREGLLLCPAIVSINNFNMQKEDKTLSVEVEILLADGTNVKAKFDDINI